MFGVLREIVSSFGLGSQVMLAATLLAVAFYVYRAVGVARLVTGVVGTLTREVLVLLVVGAVVIGLGWASPNVGTALEHVHLFAREAFDVATGPGRRLFRWVVDVAA
ncbi:hypothetical protein [Halorubrum sp. F4]|uniref:hypothetical protein n=1 Tax=Halorubrum sp. F4 TaxID=2989715 RepID=UPI0024808F77|nr:hypothetical protein [Halorubrum sp. F4]